MRHAPCLVLVFAGCFGSEPIAKTHDPDTTDARAEIESVCDPRACDDGDPCTDDRCDASGTQCVHVPADVLEACRTDAHCDDGEACTVERCVVNACGHQRCERVSMPPPCEPCNDSSDCDDHQSNTLDRCINGGRCDHVSVVGPCDDRTDVCASDADCDDANLCTSDTCLPSPCGDSRCERVHALGCRSCTKTTDCVDGYPGTLDACVDGRCTLARDPFYSEVCDLHGALPPNTGRTIVRIAHPEPCDACPCTHTDDYYTDAGFGVREVVVPGGHCTVTCASADDAQYITCEPLLWAVDYLAWLTPADGAVATITSYCVHRPFDVRRALRGTLRIGSATHAVALVPEAHDQGFVLRCDEPSCAPNLITEQPVAVRDFEPSSWKIDFELGPRRVRARLFATPTGAAGRVEPRDLDDAAIDGELHLEFDRGPVPTGW